MTQTYLGSASASGRFPDPLKGPWTVTAHYGEQDGEVVCIGLDIRAFKGTPGDTQRPPRPLARGARWEPITSGLVRGLRVADLVRDGRAHLGQLSDWLARQPSTTQKAARRAANPSKPGRPSQYNDAHYRKVADLYRANQGHAPAKAVHAALAAQGQEFSSPHDTEAQRAQVRKWIAEARRRGLIGERKDRP